MCIIKKDIKSMGCMYGNNSLTERLSIGGKIITIAEAIKDIGVVERSISYKITPRGSKIKFFLKFNKEDKYHEVSKLIWESFNELGVKLMK